MSLHNTYQADIKSDLYGLSLADGQVVTLNGDSVRGDINPYTYIWDSSSSATDNFPFIIKPTGQVGNGRYLLQSNLLVPTGSLQMWGAATAPNGWLLCDGAAVSRSAYAILFALLGTVYGSGDGSTTFNLPDLRQRFPIGVATSGTGSTLGTTGGAIDHVHTIDPPNTTTSTPSATVTGISLLGVAGAASDTHTHDVNIGPFNSGSANPPFIALNFIIKW